MQNMKWLRNARSRRIAKYSRKKYANWFRGRLRAKSIARRRKARR